MLDKKLDKLCGKVEGHYVCKGKKIFYFLRICGSALHFIIKLVKKKLFC